MTIEKEEEMMDIEELRVRSSIQVFMVDPKHPKPQVFVSGCLVTHLNRLFFLSVFHVVNYDLAPCMETNLPPNEIGPLLQPVSGWCSFDLFNVTKDMVAEEFEALLQKSKETLDITFAEIKKTLPLLQKEIDFESFKVNAGEKLILDIENIAVPDSNKTYGFFGNTEANYKDYYLESRPTLKNNLRFHRTNKYFHMFLAPEKIKRKEDYEGCSGAPILDSDGKLVALACKVWVGTNIIYGFSIQECVKLLKISLNSKML